MNKREFLRTMIIAPIAARLKLAKPICRASRQLRDLNTQNQKLLVTPLDLAIQSRKMLMLQLMRAGFPVSTEQIMATWNL